MSTALVSGAGGLIGSIVCSELLRKGFRVIGVDNQDCEANSSKENYVFFEGAPNDENAYAAAFESEQVDYFIHLACSADNDFGNIIEDKEINLSKQCDKFIYQLALESNVTHILLLSTTQVYDVKKTREPTREDGELRPVSNYAKMKFDSEKSVANLARKNKDKFCCIMRVSPVYTKSFHENLRSKIYDEKQRIAFLYMKGDYGFQFCSVYNLSDFILGYIECADNSSYTGIFNIADKNLIKACEIVAFLRENSRLGPVIQRNFGTENIKNIFANKKAEKVDYRYLDVSNILNNNGIDNNKARRVCVFKYDLNNTK